MTSYKIKTIYMIQLLKRIKSGQGLLVLLLISFAFYSSLSTKARPEATALKKIFRPVRSLPHAIIDIEYSTETDNEDEVTDHAYSASSVKKVNLNTYSIYLNDFNPFAFIKVPLLFFLFDIPPPVL